jgi:hypothetical protein
MRGVAALALVPLLAACRPHATTVLTLDVTPRDVAAGDTVRLTLTVANPRADTLRLAFEPGCAARFAIRRASDRRRVHPVPDACAALPAGDSVRVVVAPRGAWRAEHAWVPAAGDTGALVAGASLAQRTEARGGRRAALRTGESAAEVSLRVRPAR